MARFRGRQGGIVVFEVDAPDEASATIEARRYADQYAQDGAVTVQSYNGKRWATVWTKHKDIDPTDVSRLVATVDDVLKAGVPAREGEWYIARISPGREFKAIHGLAEIGVTAYCPCETRYKGKASDRWKVKIPLFMGYLFLFATGDQFYGVHQIDGVHSLLRGSQGQPKAVQVDDVERIRTKERKGRYDHTINAKEAKKETERLKANFGDLQAMGTEEATAMIMAALSPIEEDDELAAAA